MNRIDIEIKSEAPKAVVSEDFKEYKIKVISFYKGQKQQYHTLRTNDISSSCFWKPLIGKKYILYVKLSNNKNQLNILPIRDCQRRICTDDSDYKTEKKALKKLEKAKTGTFKIFYQDKIIVEGEFQKKIRQGNWIIYKPITTSQDSYHESNKILNLIYVNNELTNIIYQKPMNKYIESAYTSNWLYYYQSILNKKQTQ